MRYTVGITAVEIRSESDEDVKSMYRRKMQNVEINSRQLKRIHYDKDIIKRLENVRSLEYISH